MKCYYIHLIRHGITMGNLLGQYIGHTDISLCDEGITGIKYLKSNFEYPKADVFFISPLKRCLQTLNIIYPNTNPIVVNDLKECDFGDFEGKSAEDLKDDKRFEKWISEGGSSSPPNGENGTEFQERCCKAFEKIVNGVITAGITEGVIVAHGGTIMSILTAYGLPQAEFYDWLVGNGRGYTMRITPLLWSQQRKAEVINTLPFGDTPSLEGGQAEIVRMAKEAINKANENKE